MFVYQKGKTICVTFRDTKPVAIPEYEIVVDEATKSITVNGVDVTKNTNETHVEEVETEVVTPVEPVVEEPETEVEETVETEEVEE